MAELDRAGIELARVTHDVDAVIEREHGPVLRAVHQLGRQRGWPLSWLNDNVSVYLSKVAAQDDLRLFRDYPHEGAIGLRVYLASPRYMLAMKLASLRTGSQMRDIDDVMRLAEATGVITRDGLVDLHRVYFPDHPLDMRRLAVIDEIVGKLNAAAKPG